MNDQKDAKNLLAAADITSSQSFDSLNPAQLTAVTCEAAVAYERKHGQPMPDGSTSYVRKRFDLLQQRARS